MLRVEGECLVIASKEPPIQGEVIMLEQDIDSKSEVDFTGITEPD